MIKLIKENLYRVWYNPYGLEPDEEDCMEVTAETEEEARRRVSSSGYVTDVEEIEFKTDPYDESVSEEKDIIRTRFLEHTSYDYSDRRRLAESITNLVFRTNDKKTHMNKLLKTDLKFASKMYRDRILKCNTAEELSETLSRCSVDALKRTKESLEESKKRCTRRKLTEKSNFDDTQKAIDYYYPKWYYDDMSINDIYDRLEKLGHSQDFIDAVIDGITDRYENEEDRDLDDYNECLD